jgi:hypothetical protein
MPFKARMVTLYEMKSVYLVVKFTMKSVSPMQWAPEALSKAVKWPGC